MLFVVFHTTYIYNIRNAPLTPRNSPIVSEHAVATVYPRTVWDTGRIERAVDVAAGDMNICNITAGSRSLLLL